MILLRGLGVGGPLVTTGLGKGAGGGGPVAAMVDYIVRMRRRSRRA